MNSIRHKGAYIRAMHCCGSKVEDSVVAVAPSAQQQEASVAKKRKESRLTTIDDQQQQQQKKQHPEDSPSQEPISDRRVEREVEADHSATVNQGQSINPNNNNNNSMSITATPRSQHSSARDSSQNLGSALKEAWSLLVADNPDAAEANEIQRAIELSLLDCALVYHPSSNTAVSVLVQPPHAVLGVSPNATKDQIKAAYRKLVIKTHPDKPGGCRHEFEKVAAAYRSLLATTTNRRTNNDGVSVMRSTDASSKNNKHNMSAATTSALKSTAHWDAEIKSHWDLVNELFANHDTSVDELAAKQHSVRSTLGLKHKEAGASNRNEQNELIRNSCFYLSLAVSYLNGIGALMCPPFETTTRISIASKMEGGDEQEMLRATDDALISHTALQLKRTIEAAVMKAHPEWARAGL